MVKPGTILALAAFFVASPALADDRDYCPTRPSLGTSACIMSPGRVSVETAIADWTLENDADERTDTLLIGDTLVRVGLTDRIEAQVGWTLFGHVRTRDKLVRTVDTADRVGDVTLGLRANFQHPDGKGLSFGAQPFVTLPVGRSPVGAGDWGAGVIVPVSYDLSDTINLQFTPEIDAAPNEDSSGRHLAYSGVLGLGVELTKAVSTTIEVTALRDEDPVGPTTERRAALSLAWLANDDLQLDLGGVVGLDHDAPDAEVYAGISRRF